MKDRLIELIRNAPRKDVVYGDIKLDKPVQTVQTIADHLLANGVTVQEWISVKDRLPKHGEICLVYSIYEQTDIRQFDSVEMMWCGENLYNDFRMSQVTHWMPLPQPPKGA